MTDIPALSSRVAALEAELGAITAFMLVRSRESSKTVRDCTKHTESLGVDLRKSLIEFDKSLTINESN